MAKHMLEDDEMLKNGLAVKGLIPEKWYHIRHNLRLRWVPSKVNFKNKGFQTKLKPIVITFISLSKSIV